MNICPFAAGARFITSAIACADSSAGMIPSVRASCSAAAERLRIACRGVFGALPVVQPGVLGTDQSGNRDRPKPSASAPPGRRHPAGDS